MLIGKPSINLLESWDVEDNLIHDKILEHVRLHRPQRILIDSPSQMRYLSADTFQFRKQVLSLLRTRTGEGATVIFTSEESADEDDQALPFLSDRVISLETTEYDLSYVADNIIMLRYIELDGELRKTIGVLKKRAGSFEKALREFDITQDGLKVGRPLHGMRGLLSGVPEVIQPQQGSDSP